MKQPSIDELMVAFEEIESKTSRGEINAIICTVCGCNVSTRNDTMPCEHLKRLIPESARLEELGSVQNIVQQPHAVKVEDSHIPEAGTSA
jgi:hypothetical protein